MQWKQAKPVVNGKQNKKISDTLGRIAENIKNN